MGIIKSAFKAVTNVVKKVLSSPILSGLASFIPVVGPFISIAAKVYQAYQAAKSGNILGAAMGLLGGTGVGGALSKTFSGLMSKVSGMVSPSVLSFATSAAKALGGNSADVSKIVDFAGQALKGTDDSILQQAIKHNATRLAQYAQAQAFV
jgi:hypothetical protein